MRNPAFCICENKGADQLRGNREADQRLCFLYIASKIPLLPKYKNSSLQLSSVFLRFVPDLVGNWPEDRFSDNEGHLITDRSNAVLLLPFSHFLDISVKLYVVYSRLGI